MKKNIFDLAFFDGEGAEKVPEKETKLESETSETANSNQITLLSINEELKKIAKNNELNDKLYSDLRKYQEGIIQETTLPLLKGIISIINDLERKSRFSAEDTQLTNEILQRLKDLLFEFDIYEIESDNTFNAKNHRIIKVIPTDDDSLNNVVAKKLSSGFQKGDQVIVKEAIELYKK